jgi:3-hydroxyisobutyrate dehydrogenase-like beta-hydroxyacid dehydrogenase
MPTNVLNKHKVRLGFIGLGIMGSRLAQRLHASGWNIQAWNRSPEPARELMQAGVPIPASVWSLSPIRM